MGSHSPLCTITAVEGGEREKGGTGERRGGVRGGRLRHDPPYLLDQLQGGREEIYVGGGGGKGRVK